MIQLHNRQYELSRPDLKNRSRELRKNATLSEVLLWEQLKGRQILNYKFRRQERIIDYIVDFYCKELKLAIEIDGFSHDFKMEYDTFRQKSLEQLGVHMLRFQDEMVKQDMITVVQQIVDWINGHAMVSPTPTPPKRGIE